MLFYYIFYFKTEHIWISIIFHKIIYNTCYQFRILRNLRIDIKDRLEEYSQSIEIDILIIYGDLNQK